MAESAIMKSLNGRKVYDEDARKEMENIKNAAPGLVFDTVADMEAYIAGNANTLKVGQDLFIRAADVPDYWWDGTAAVPVETELGEVKKEIAELSEAIAGLGGTLVEPAEDNIPKVFFKGTAPQTKAEDELPLEMEYVSKTLRFHDYVTLKVQGDSSAGYPKKNFNLKMFSDADRTEKDKRVFRDWSKTHKYCLKANWIDHTHARNVVGGRLWGQVVRSRADYESYPVEYRESANCGAVNGFPVKVYLNGVYQGLYTWNIRKDESMFNMDDETGTHAALIADVGNSVTAWRSLPSINGTDWTDELNDVVPDAVKTGFRNAYSFVINSTDEEFKANIGQYFYPSSLIDYYIYIYSILMIGGLSKSQTMFTYDSVKYLANIYDMDTTWALHWTGTSFYDVETPCPSGYATEANLLYERLEKLFPDKIKERYAELRASVLSNANIINEFERFMDVIPPYLYDEDFASTTADGIFTDIPSKTTNTLQKLREIIVKRMAYCDANIPLIGEETTPDEPDTPEVTPSSISAVYNGGDVAVGTALTALTGIVVTATYPDGSTETVTGYTLSGVIAEGQNTITVTYRGVTATFTVTGVVPDESDTPLYPLADGTFKYDDGSVLTISNGNHIEFTDAIPDETVQSFLNATNLNRNVAADRNDPSSVNNLSDVWFTIPANSTVRLSVTNNGLYDRGNTAFGIRETGKTPSIISATPTSSGTAAENTVTVKSDTQVSCLFAFTPNKHVSADVELYVDGVRWI